MEHFGKRLKFQESKKSRIKKEIDVFKAIIDNFEKCWMKSNKLYSEFKVGLMEYEEDFFLVIEDLILIKYGEWKTDIILWYIYYRKSEKGEIYPLMLTDAKGKTENITLNNSEELYNILKKLDTGNETEEEKL